MKSAFAAESWHTEHRPAMDFHGKMTRYEMAGARGPSIAQLLDQNLLSPQQAAASLASTSEPPKRFWLYFVDGAKSPMSAGAVAFEWRS